LNVAEKFRVIHYPFRNLLLLMPIFEEVKTALLRERLLKKVWVKITVIPDVLNH
jgi:hypothetical protein